MPVLTDLARTDLLSGLDIQALSLHSDYDQGGLFELTGGDPAYARMPPTFSSPVNGVMSAAGVPYIFDVPPASTVAWIGMWDGGGGFLGMTPNGGSIPQPFVVVDANNGVLTAPKHGFSDGDNVVAWQTGPMLPDGTIWVVTVVDTDNLTLLALDNTPPNFTTSFTGFLQLIIVQTFADQSTFPLNSFAINTTLVG